MRYAEYKALYLTPENVSTFAQQQDSMVWVSDLTGDSIDHPWVEWLTHAFDAEMERQKNLQKVVDAPQ